MALWRPRLYEWRPEPQYATSPFSMRDGITPAGHRRISRCALRAADGRKIPFPLVILASEHYWARAHCRTLVMMEDGMRPRYPGIDYVMEIQLSGHQGLVDNIQEIVRPFALGIPRTQIFGPIGQGVMAVFHPSEMGREHHWSERATFDSGTAMVRYDYMPGRG